ncbi:MAG TPA: hypothetical protein VI911_04865 [Patescibacteria group bacterium]|nr:MAG: hypothetical protein A2417_04510 [Bdellovibrionales bacterium RIFOXYC1_FULL_37_79]HLD90333.1 hypothetical protein [Patescibacteria group bacterium]
MKKRILLIGGNSKIARAFTKKYFSKYQIDITLYKKNDIGQFLNEIDTYQLNLTNDISIKNLIKKLKDYKYSGVLFFSSIYSNESNWNKSKFTKMLKINFLSYLDLIYNLKLVNNSKIIFFTDEGLIQPKKNYLYYSFSKALLKDYIRFLAVEFAQTSSVIGIGLGPTTTDQKGPRIEQYYKRSLISVKNPCLGLINLIDFILSEENFYSTGKIIPFDGGTYIKRLT